MSDTQTLAAKICSLKIGQSFIVKTQEERKEALGHIKTLREAGKLAFDVKTTSTKAGFKIYAI
jgi:hypothetical protein